MTVKSSEMPQYEEETETQTVDVDTIYNEFDNIHDHFDKFQDINFDQGSFYTNNLPQDD